MTDYKKYISIDAKIRFGRPILTGTRITVYDVLSWLASRMSHHEEMLSDYPELIKEHIFACLSYAAARGHHIRVV